MANRLESVIPSARSEPPVAAALRQSLREGYTGPILRADIMAGCVVGIVALPLSMALAINSGVPPQNGLYTAIVAGALIALLGGSRVQVSGPTAAFVVILAPIAQKFGLGGLLVATMMAGAILLTMGFCRLGRLIEFIPYPVTTGFTAGIAVVIATMQVGDFLGLTLPKPMPEHFLDRVFAIMESLPTCRVNDLGIGLLTLVVLLAWPRVSKRVPGPLVALPLGAAVAYVLSRVLPEFHVATIASRFTYTIDGQTLHGIPPLPPLPGWPWHFGGAEGAPLEVSWTLIRALIGPAFAIAMLGAIESLLSAVVADGLTGQKHDPDAELVAQGVGNIAAPFFGGFAATGAIARTATNVRSGARTPVAAIVHALFVLAAMLSLAPLLGYLPMASMAALLLVVARNMAEVKHFTYVVRVAPRSDVAVLLTCFGLTVLFDMTISVSVGVVLAAMLFMRRMAELADVRRVVGGHPLLAEPLPKEVMMYEIAGPLFFGAAQKAMSALHSIGGDVRVVVLDVNDVPNIDATGLVNLESTLDRLYQAGVFVVLGGVNPQPMRLFVKAGWRGKRERVAVRRSVHEALVLARQLVSRPEAAPRV